MGKKVKIGKQRRDKYYHLAKEAGYRSRAAFKLIQLNKRFEFLERSRAVVDLCAAPGGWMQVARQNMPVSGVIIGVDLVPIRAINNCITLQGDITTEKTRQAIKKELQTWEADTVLHDGAPNVGQNWTHDAFQQNCLTLSALKLATQILKRGGTFVTKVFRSNDYAFLVTTFEKLFKKVHVWKPAASRLESAEIFVVCEKYTKPAKVDPALVDPKKVFLRDDLEPKPTNAQLLLQANKKDRKAKAEGYADDGSLALHKEISATEFISTKKGYLDLLAAATVIILDDDKWRSAKATTPEVRECLKDIKTCGPRELRTILNWRKQMIALTEEKDNEEEEMTIEVEKNAEQIEDEEMAALDEEIARASAEEKAALKKKKKKMLREKAKLLRRRQLKMVHEGDYVDIPEEIELFSLAKIRKAKELRSVMSEKVETPEVEEDEEEGLGEGEWETKQREEDEEQEENELLHTEEQGLSKEQKAESRADQWFAREGIAELLGEEDEDEDMDVVEKHMKRRVDKKELYANTEKSKKRKAEEDDELDVPLKSHFEDEEGLDSGDEFEDEEKRATKRDVDDGKEPKAKKRRLTPEQLALGEQLIYSSKTAKNLEDWGWNRYTNNDDNLPDWFVEDEKKHYRKQLPVTKAQVAVYRERLKELNTRPIKKVAEARARKLRREAMRLEKAKKKAQSIVDNDNMDHPEKLREMKKVYKNAAKNEKKEVKYQVVTKGKAGKMARPSGRYKLVDRRLKKDNRKQKAESRKKGHSARRPHKAAGKKRH